VCNSQAALCLDAPDTKQSGDCPKVKNHALADGEGGNPTLMSVHPSDARHRRGTTFA
jgi:hypothetical protein